MLAELRVDANALGRGLLVAVFLAVGCAGTDPPNDEKPDDEPDAGGDTRAVEEDSGGAMDAQPADAADSGVDASPADTAPGETGTDTAVVDAAPDTEQPSDVPRPSDTHPDTPTPDSGTADTGMPDTQMPDTQMPDTQMPDTAPRVDTGSGVGQPTMSGQLVVTEFMADPDVLNDSDAEWFEVHNPHATRSYDLKGCLIEDLDSDSHTVGSSLVVAPGGYAVLSIGPSPGTATDYVYGGGWQLANSGDEIVVKCGGTVIDEVNYDTGPNFSNPTGGASTSLDPNKIDATKNDDGMNWCDGTNNYTPNNKGTPGTSNTLCP